MQFTRTIASIVALSLALCALPTRAESEDTPLPGDFQLAPAARPPKAKPLNLPPVSPASSADKAAEPAPRAAATAKRSKHKASQPARKADKQRAAKPAREARRQQAAAKPGIKRNVQRQQAGKRGQVKARQMARSKKATALKQAAVRQGKTRQISRQNVKRKNISPHLAQRKKAAKKPKAVKKPAHSVAKTKK